MSTERAAALYALIVSGDLHVDLERERLDEPYLCRVHPSEDAALLAAAARQLLGVPVPGAITIVPGAHLIISGVAHEVVLSGNPVLLRSERGDLVSMSTDELSDLAARGLLAGVGPPVSDDPVATLIAGNRTDDVDGVVAKLGVLNDVAAKRPVAVSASTVGRYRAQRKVSLGAMVPRKKHRGNRKPRYPERTYEIAREVIASHLATSTAVARILAFGVFLQRLDAEGLKRTGRGFFDQRIAEENRHKLALARGGRKAAYSSKPFADARPLGDRRAQRPWEMVHIDHTRADIQLRDSRYRDLVLGRPWLTMMVDEFTRRILAFHVSYDPPSRRSVMAILRLCVERHGRLPEGIMFDGGPEFASTQVERLLGTYEVLRCTRPPSEPRFGAALERLILTTNLQLLHNLEGNTKLARNVRELTPGFDPRHLATYTLRGLRRFLEAFFFRFYDNEPHDGLYGVSPALAWATSVHLGGEHPFKVISNTPDFTLATMVEGEHIQVQINDVRGVQIDRFWYWNEHLATPGLHRKSVSVLLDELDARRAAVQVDGRWHEARSPNLVHLENVPMEEIWAVSAEIRQRRRLADADDSNAAVRLAEFFDTLPELVEDPEWPEPVDLAPETAPDADVDAWAPRLLDDLP